jgi:hypothetical protein
MKKILLLLYVSASIKAAPNAKPAITSPLQVKVYSNPSPPFQLDEKEKPIDFKPFGNPYGKFSWIYKAQSKPTRDEHYILVGYSDANKNDILNKGVYKILSNPLFLCTTPLTPAAPPATLTPPPAAPVIEAAATTSQAPIGTLQVTPSQQAVPTAQPPVAPAPNLPPQAGLPSPAPIAPPPQPLAPQVIKEPELTIYTCDPAAQTGPVLMSNVPAIPGNKPSIRQPKKLLLELKMICSNDPAKEVTKEEVEKILPGAKVYGNAFDLPRHKKCHFIATDYDNNTPPTEMQEMMKQIYYAVKGPYNIFN